MFERFLFFKVCVDLSNVCVFKIFNECVGGRAIRSSKHFELTQYTK